MQKKVGEVKGISLMEFGRAFYVKERANLRARSFEKCQDGNCIWNRRVSKWSSWKGSQKHNLDLIWAHKT